MSSNESHRNCSSAVIVIIIVISLLSKPVMGKPLLGSPEEESPNFQSNDLERTQLMKGKLIKRDPFDQSHLPDAVQPLIRLLRLQNPDGMTTDHGINTARPRVRFGKRSSTANFTGDLSFAD